MKRYKVTAFLRHGNQKRLRYWTEKVQAMLMLSPDCRCAACGDDDITVLTFDHVNGDGNEDRRQNAQHIQRQILRGRTKDMRILCQNCNHRAWIFGPDISTWPEFKRKDI